MSYTQEYQEPGKRLSSALIALSQATEWPIVRAQAAAVALGVSHRATKRLIPMKLAPKRQECANPELNIDEACVIWLPPAG